MKRNKAKAEDIFRGRTVVVRGCDGREKKHSEWIRLTLKYQSQSAEILALVIESVEYDFLLSRPDMKLLKINIHSDDTVSVSQDVRHVEKRKEIRIVTKADDITGMYP